MPEGSSSIQSSYESGVDMFTIVVQVPDTNRLASAPTTFC